MVVATVFRHGKKTVTAAMGRYCVQVKERGTSAYVGIYWTDHKVVARRYAEAMAQRRNVEAVRILDERTGYTVHVGAIDK